MITHAIPSDPTLRMNSGRYGLVDHTPRPLMPDKGAAIVLDRAFNAAVLTIARRLFPCGFDVGADAPDTLAKLTAHVNRTGRMLVWNGASERTIYGDPEVNFAFRAWHDWHHWRWQLPFNPEGEARVCERQIDDVRKVYGVDARAKWAPILRAEVIGQGCYERIYGKHPEDQFSFVRAYVEHGHSMALSRRW